MFNYISANYYKNKIPNWMAGTRLECLMLYDRWLEGSFYDEIPLSFNDEKTGNKYNMLHTRRPAVQHNFPAFIAGLTARKLFGGRHVPRLKHKDLDFLAKIQALIEELRLPLIMLEAVKRGSVGSVLILFKFLTVPVRDMTPEELMSDTLPEIPTNVKGVVEVKQTQYCTPMFNQFKELTGVMEHYLVMGTEMLLRGMNTDRDGDQIDPARKYWYVKMFDTHQECIYFPLQEHKWNPVNGGRYASAGDALVPYPLLSNPYVHNLGFVQGVWIKNLTGGKHPDGLSTWGNALNNFIEIDYAKSQNGRGLKYASAPQLVLKGDLREEAETGEAAGQQPRDPAYMLRMAADSKDGMGTDSSGHDAKLLETNGAAAKASDDFVNSLKHTTFEQICSARKDLESIKGTMSGKVIELIDEDFMDLLQELRLNYGTYGYLILVKLICKAAIAAGHLLMSGVTELMIDGLTIDYPPLYLPDGQEIQFLISGFVEATQTSKPGPKGADGAATTITVEPLIDPRLAAQFLAKQLDLVEESEDRPVISGTQTQSDGLPEPEAEDANGIASSSAEGMIISALQGDPINSSPPRG